MQLTRLALSANLAVALSSLASAQSSFGREDRSISQPFLTVGLGATVEVDGDRAIASDSGSVVIFTPTTARIYERGVNGEWLEEGVFTSSTPGANLGFGAALALDGDTAIIGEPGTQFDAGKVYVVERLAGTWTVTSVFGAPIPALADRFGAAIALDGNRAIIGAPGANSSRGEVHVFDRDPVSGVWSPSAAIDLAGAAPTELFGYRVELVDDRVLASAPNRDVGAVIGAGSVHAFKEQSAGSWVQTQVITSTSPGINHDFGTAMAAQGERLVVGAASDNQAGALNGAAHVFDRDATGTNWLPVDVLRVPNDPSVGFFPSLASVAAGEASVVVGHYSSPGALHVFEETTAGTFRPAVRLEPSNLPATPSVTVGLGASLATDGDTLLAGVPAGGPPGLLGMSGEVYEFTLGTLYHDANAVLLPGPGAQRHFVRATDAHAFDFYYFLGTASGTVPGTIDPVSGLSIPINVDPYTTFLISTGGAGLTAPFGVLDANGRAKSAFVLPPFSSPSLAGTRLGFCALVIDSTTFVATAVTNAVSADLE